MPGSSARQHSKRNMVRRSRQRFSVSTSHRSSSVVCLPQILQVYMANYLPGSATSLAEQVPESFSSVAAGGRGVTFLLPPLGRGTVIIPETLSNARVKNDEHSSHSQ